MKFKTSPLSSNRFGRQVIKAFFKKPLLQKRQWSPDFPPRKTLVAQKHRAIFRQEKMACSSPSGCLGTSLPLPQSLCGRPDGRTDVRTYGRTDGRTDGRVTITSEPKFLGLIVYQISLVMELRWRALPTGSAIIKWSPSTRNSLLLKDTK